MTRTVPGSRPFAFVLASAMGFIAGGCARPEYSGFLAPYTDYKKVSEISPDLEYVRPAVHWDAYRKVRIAQVTVIVEPHGGLRAVDPDELKRLTDHFEAKLADAFKHRYPLTSEAGANVLDVRAVITRLRPTSRTTNTASWVIPGSFVIEAGYKAATNSNLALGEAGVEVEFRDSVTRQRQYGFVGLHLGSSIEVQQMTRWGIAEKSLDKWAGFLANRLETLARSASPK